jgi:protein-export membrane protein SecD/preprotein translocase SecF subunit
VALCLLSIWALFPRKETIRYRGADGLLYADTSRRVPLRKGLDLQGGIYLALEIKDSKHAIPASQRGELIDRALRSVRNRIDAFGVSEPVVQKEGDRIVVNIPGIQDPERAQRLVEQQAFLQFQMNDKTQALERALPRLDQVVKQRGLIAQSTDTSAKAQTAATVRGLQSLLTRDTSKNDPAELRTGIVLSSLLQQGGIPGQFYVMTDNIPTLEKILADSTVNAALPPGKVFRPGVDSVSLQGKWYKSWYLLDAKPAITGESLKNAQPAQDPNEGTIVQFELDRPGARQFETETAKHLGDYMAIVLDDRVMSTAIIHGAIATHGQITMAGKSLAAAQDLALVLRAGALPVPLRVAEVHSIGPSLGQDSINQGMRAMVIAVALVVIIMLACYRFSGMLAVGGLALYVLYTLAVLAGFDAVLTLPSIAGFVLSIGMAVDANVLIFERMREELDRGKTARTAIDEGFRHAMPAIVDSNVSTILTAAVLYQFGTGAVKGFAVALIAGIAASLVTSIFVVRTFYILWLNRSRGAQTLKHLTVPMLRRLHNTAYDFIKHGKTAAISTIAFILLGFALLGVHAARHNGRALNESIEFTGGTVVQLRFAQPPNPDVVRAAVDEAGFPGSEVTTFGGANAYQVKVQQGEGEGAAANADGVGGRIGSVLMTRAPGNTVQVQRADAVGSSVGAELTTRAITAIIISFIVTLIYLAFRFEWRFALAATLATMHDILTTLAFLAMMRLEISLTVVAAILTVIGYSLNDTIIIFDRVRENQRKQRKESLRDVLNRSINETLPRSVLTHTTVLAATLALLIFGGEVIRPFSWIMAFGVFTGTFSSVYVAGAILLWIEHRWPRATAGETKGTARTLAEERRRERPEVTVSVATQ